MNRFFIKTYGCQMNERDSEAVAAMLRGRGYVMTDEADADIVLLNTCSVRDLAEQKAIGKTGHLGKRRRRNPNFIIGIMGCMAQNRGEELLEKLPDLDLLVGTQKFHRVPDMLDNLIAQQQALGPKPSTLVELDAEEGSAETIRQHLADRPQVAAYVSIMQGCNMNCAFCIVPKTRGPERYRSMETIEAEVRELVEAGAREVTLLGQIVNSYGIRQMPTVNRRSPFVQLLDRLHDIDGLERLRFTSPHPKGFQEDLIQAYGRLPKLMPNVHLPLQSGSDRILKLMRRPYTVRRYREIVQRLRSERPGITLSTDVIVGFPGETDEDFQATAELFDDIAFEMAFVFKYSERSGTLAAGMGDTIPQSVKESRNQHLLEILEKHSLAYNQSRIGCVEEVLVEGPAKRGEDVFVGRTPGNRKVVFKAQQRLVGQLLPVEITGAGVSSLHGELQLAGIDEPRSF